MLSARWLPLSSAGFLQPGEILLPTPLRLFPRADWVSWLALFALFPTGAFFSAHVRDTTSSLYRPVLIGVVFRLIWVY